MALRLSTGLRNALLDKKAEAVNIFRATTISFETGTGTGGRDRILDSGSGMSNFVKRGKISVSGSASGNDGSYEILAVAAGYVEVEAGSLTDESAGLAIVLATAKGGSFADLFQNCTIDIFTGSQPASADDGETGTKLLTVTLNKGAFVVGEDTNGLNFGEVSAGVLSKEPSETWSGEGLVDGIAGWFRIYDNNKISGASSTAIRMDGSIGTSGSQLNMSSTSVVTGGTTTVDSVSLTMPSS